MTQSSVAEIFQNSNFRVDDHIISASDHNNCLYFIIAYILNYPENGKNFILETVHLVVKQT
jgi:hypothetical protein